jgi:hypothetical protein
MFTQVQAAMCQALRPTTMLLMVVPFFLTVLSFTLSLASDLLLYDQRVIAGGCEDTCGEVPRAWVQCVDADPLPGKMCIGDIGAYVGHVVSAWSRLGYAGSVSRAAASGDFVVECPRLRSRNT